MDLTEKTGNMKRHPWELSRAYNIIKLLEKDSNTIYADIGAGDKFFTSKLVSITNGKVYAIDTGYECSEINESGILSLNDLSILENESIDCLLLMDVLEHVENDDVFLNEVLAKLKSNGKIIITVPAMQFLFSSHDIFLKHYRRYNRRMLIDLLKKHSLIIDQCFYFYTTLFFLRCISLLFYKIGYTEKNQNVGIGVWKYSPSSYFTIIITYALNVDFLINKLLNNVFIRLPGLSLLAVCRKNE